jgi:hypothetical protein
MANISLKEAVINEHFAPIFEASKNSAEDTVTQELFTCVCFDLFFNCNKKFRKFEDIKEWLDSSESTVVDEIGQKVKDFRARINDMVDWESKKTTTEKTTAKGWLKSFYAQCISFDNFLSEHKNLPSSGITFLHHDTGLGVRDGKVSTGWSILADRVNNGVKKLNGGGDKDNWQKADIYAVWDNTDSAIPADSIPAEVTYWTSAATGDNAAGDKFLGISLKKIKGVIGHVKIYNLESADEAMEASDTEFKINPWKDAQYTSDEDFKSGLLTAYINFKFKWGKEESSKILSLKSNSLGDDHIDRKKAWDFYHAIATIELSTKNGLANEGKAMTFINKIYKELGQPKEKNPSYWDSNQANVWISEINSMCDEFKVAGIPEMTSDAKQIIDTTFKNRAEIETMFKEWDNRKKNPDYDEAANRPKILMYAKAIKWKVIIFKQLMMIKAILTYAKKMQADQKERGVDLSAPGALFLLLVDLVKGAKGLSDRCLPYVMLA